MFANVKYKPKNNDERRILLKEFITRLLKNNNLKKYSSMKIVKILKTRTAGKSKTNAKIFVAIFLSSVSLISLKLNPIKSTIAIKINGIKK